MAGFAEFAILKAEHEAALIVAAEAHKARAEAVAKAKALAPKVKVAGLVPVAVERDGVTIYRGPVANAPAGDLVEATDKHKIALSVGKARADYAKELGFCLRDIENGVGVGPNETRAAVLLIAGIVAAPVPAARPSKHTTAPTLTPALLEQARAIIEAEGNNVQTGS